jgi:hypothetical protein
VGRGKKFGGGRHDFWIKTAAVAACDDPGSLARRRLERAGLLRAVCQHRVPRPEPHRGQQSDDQDDYAGQLIEELAPSLMPPCVDERVSFMADHDLILRKQHPYKGSSPETHGHFGETTLRLEAFSAACIPFGWMLKSNVEGDERSGEEGKAAALRLAYEPEREPELAFETAGSRTRSTNWSCWTRSSVRWSPATPYASST